MINLFKIKFKRNLERVAGRSGRNGGILIIDMPFVGVESKKLIGENSNYCLPVPLSLFK